MSSLFKDKENKESKESVVAQVATQENTSANGSVNGSAIVPKGATAIASREVAADELESMFDISDNMDGTEPRLPSIKVLSQGQMFEMPDETKVSVIEGVIVDSNRVNAFWESAFSGEGTAPNCASYDGIKPNCEAPLSATCATCHKNKYGSDGSRGKACKNMRRVHVLINGNQIPFRLTLPPTSLRSYDDFMVQLSNIGRPYPTVMVRISLEKAKNKDGIAYSVVKFVIIENIDDREKLLKIKRMKQTMVEQMQRESIVADEYEDHRQDHGQDGQQDGQNGHSNGQDHGADNDYGEEAF